MNGHAERDQDPAMTNGVSIDKQPEQQSTPDPSTQEEQQQKDTPARSPPVESPTAPVESSASKSPPVETPTAPVESSASKSPSPAQQPATDDAPASNGIAPSEETSKPASPEKEGHVASATPDAQSDPKPSTPNTELPADQKSSPPTDLSVEPKPSSPNTELPTNPKPSSPNTESGPTEASTAPSTEKPAETPAEAPAAPKLPAQSQDQEMPDAPPMSPTKAARGREEDSSEEPPAKRAKTDESQGDAQFKMPELPASANVSNSGSAPADISPVTPLRKKFLVRTIQNLRRHPKGRFFKDPVNYKVMGIPSYPDIVKQPMDLSTIEKKVKTDQYRTMDQVNADMHLIVYNTTTFNGEDHQVTKEGVVLEQYYHELLAKLPGRDEAESAPSQKKASKKATIPSIKAQPQREARVLPPKKPAPAPATASTTFALSPEGLPVIRRDSTTADGRPKRSIHPPKNRDFPFSTKPKKKKFQWELKFCQEVLDELRKGKYYQIAMPFYDPVDPVALNIPTYHSVIKKPMDLRTMQQKLHAGSYENSREFEGDMRLMFKNSQKFNIPGDPVYTAGKRLEEVFQHKWNQKTRWLEAHEPPSAQQSSSEESDEEPESDEDHEKLSELQRQIAEMSKQVDAITKKKRTPPVVTKKGTKAKGKIDVKKSAGKKDKKGGAKKPEKARWVSYQEKQLISNGIGSLSEKRMGEALQIIQKNVPHLKVSHVIFIAVYSMLILNRDPTMVKSNSTWTSFPTTSCFCFSTLSRNMPPVHWSLTTSRPPSPCPCWRPASPRRTSP